MAAFNRLTLTRQFLITSFPILVVGLLIIGFWVGNRIEVGVMSRTASVTGLYVDSWISNFLQSLTTSATLDNASRKGLDRLLTDTPLGQKIVAFKIWNRDGEVLYSTDPTIIGKRFPMGEGLKGAFRGIVHTEVSDLTGEENTAEKKKWSRLIETYSPVHAHDRGDIIAVAEFYQTTDELAAEIRAAQLKSWLLVSGVMLTMYALIFGLVRRGSRTIARQQRQLTNKVIELSTLATQNAQLHERVRRAAARTTELNEIYLRRIATDLHDGPCQDVGLALMRFETFVNESQRCPTDKGLDCPVPAKFRSIHAALKSALSDLRSISSGLQLPDIEPLKVDEVIARAVRDYELKSGARVALSIEGCKTDASLPVRITIYRLLQESLSNGFRHAEATNQQVASTTTTGEVLLSITDSGPGFDPDAIRTGKGGGLTGMRERVEVLGGSFNLQTAPGQGTVVSVGLPLLEPGLT